MKAKLSAALVAASITAAIMLATPSSSKATSILVAQCIAGTTCATAMVNPTPWTDTLSLADLTALGLGTTQPFDAAQTGTGFVRLGVTTITFTTSGLPIMESLPAFNGVQQPTPPFLVATVGVFNIPSNALSAVISGTFGNGVAPTGIPSSAPVDLFLGPVPGPIVGAGLPGLVAACTGLVALARRRRQKIA